MTAQYDQDQKAPYSNNEGPDWLQVKEIVSSWREAMSPLPHVSINLILGLTLPMATLNRLEVLINKVCCFL